MGMSELRQSIETLWATNWTVTPSKIDNAPFTQPGTQNIARQPWVALYIDILTSYRASLGASGANIAVHRHEGLITVQVFTDLNVGTNLGWSLATQVRNIWRDQEFNLNAYLGGTGETVRFLQEPTVEKIGDDGHGWFQFNVKARFQYDEIT